MIVRVLVAIVSTYQHDIGRMTYKRVIVANGQQGRVWGATAGLAGCLFEVGVILDHPGLARGSTSIRLHPQAILALSIRIFVE